MTTSILRVLILTLCFVFSTGAMVHLSAAPVSFPTDTLAKAAPEIRKSGHTIKGDKAFAKLKFDKAVTQYTQAIGEDDDSLRIIQRLAESYKMLGNRAEAEKCYARLADNPKAKPINKYYYAEMLKGDKNYTAAMKYYEDYLKAVPDAKNVKEAVANPAKLQDLQRDNGAYSIAPLDINTPRSEYAPVFYKDSQLIFTSNRSCKKAVYDKWSLDKGSKIYFARVSTDFHFPTIKGQGILGDKVVNNEPETPKQIKLKAAGTCFKSTATYNGGSGELIFAAGSFKKKKTMLQNGKQLPVMKLYSTMLVENSGSGAMPLGINDEFSNAQPALSKDGKTLYFASDRIGGQGGTDIYVSTRNANGIWGDPKNLGADVNTQYDEKFPFIADDGTLYFSANTPNGLGGLDIYKTKMTDGKWSKPENLGAPVNSSSDDFSFIIDGSNKTGFFASNRPGGTGEDDIYRFAFDETKLDYTVTIRVIDASTYKPVAAASVALDCKTENSVNTMTGLNGEKKLLIDGGKACTVSAWSPGYKNGSVEVSPTNKNGLLMIELKPDIFKVQVTVKDVESTLPVIDKTISVLGSNDTIPVNYSTGSTGSFEMSIPGGNYKIFSSDYPDMEYQYSTSEGTSKEILVSKGRTSLNVPVIGEGISSPVTVSNVATGQTSMVNPNANGDIRLDLNMNTKYLLAYEGTSKTISTNGLVPGEQIEGTKFHVGQTWVVPNIYYDLNKWNIRKDAASELDKLVRLMKENPTLEIELSSHTDCRSSARYNVVLSARRAKSAIDYVTKKGIKVKRFIAVGYGESRLTNNCYCEPTDASVCTLEQHAANRRTEVRVLKY